MSGFMKDTRIRFRIWFSETLFQARKALSRYWNLFLEKGHEKMTVMLIPHNEKKIFNFQISKFIMSFFFLLFMIILVTSSYTMMKNRAIKKEEQRLLSTYEDIRSHLLRFEKMTNSISDEINDLKPKIEELYMITAGTDNPASLWALKEYDQRIKEESTKYKNVMPGEVFTLMKLQRDIVCTTSTIQTVKSFIDIRSKVVKDTPSIVPNHGHITSLFGWRRSPFGHGRDFHTGIDVAAASGTVIRATAPGVVSSANWGGGYGNMIRIKHKYGYETVYGHLRGMTVQSGQYIKKGQIIGYVGQTGNATGNHCHYEIRLGGMPINPYPYMSRVW